MFADVCCHVHAEWRIKPQDVSLQRITRAGWLAWCVGELMVIATFVECLLIDALSKHSLSNDISDNLLVMDTGTFLSMDGGWLDSLWTYNGMLPF